MNHSDHGTCIRPQGAFTNQLRPAPGGQTTPRDQTTRSGIVHSGSHHPDWRGWLALAWVAGWGWAYAVMAFHARAPQVLAWLRRWSAGH